MPPDAPDDTAYGLHPQSSPLIVGLGRICCISDRADLENGEAEATESPRRGNHPSGLHLDAQELASPCRLQPAAELIICDDLIQAYHGPANSEHRPPVLWPAIPLACFSE